MKAALNAMVSVEDVVAVPEVDAVTFFMVVHPNPEDRIVVQQRHKAQHNWGAQASIKIRVLVLIGDLAWVLQKKKR